MAKISIHLVTWNAEKYLENCLNSVLGQISKDYFVLVIDNSSSDKTAQIMEEQFIPIFGQRLRFLKNRENIGFAKAHNQAILWTDSEYILTLNQDVVLSDNFTIEAIKFLDEHKDVAAVSGKVLRATFEKSEDLKNMKKTDIIDSLGLKIFKSQRAVEIGAGEKDAGQFEKIEEIFGVSANSAVFRRSALNDVRYGDEFFDNDFFSYKEDVDLAYRLRLRGWKSYYLPQAVCYHERTAKSREKIRCLGAVRLRKHKTKFVNYYSYKNHLFILLKNLSAKNFFRYFFQIFFYELGKFLYILFFEWKTLSGLKDFFGKYKKMKEKRRFIMKNRLSDDLDIRRWFV
ncbi:glycosyltransferase family 2 protein [Candidatus Falkowbacteria bacterium]|nr:glycosyltransferase family 2 protein [Candidatus Falkowbacteria bacterium]